MTEQQVSHEQNDDQGQDADEGQRDRITHGPHRTAEPSAATPAATARCGGAAPARIELGHERIAEAAVGAWEATSTGKFPEVVEPVT
jgi:hypothetical protein